MTETVVAVSFTTEKLFASSASIILIEPSEIKTSPLLNVNEFDPAVPRATTTPFSPTVKSFVPPTDSRHER